MKKLTLFWILIFTFHLSGQDKLTALKFDEFSYSRTQWSYNNGSYVYDYRYDVGIGGYNYKKIGFNERVMRFAQEILKQKDSTAYIIFYNQRKGKFPLDKGKTESQEVVRILTNQSEYGWKPNPKYPILPNRIVSIDGGFREVPTLEFWIVPQHTETPKPTPTFSSAETAVCPEIRVIGDSYQKDRKIPLGFSVEIKDQEPNTKISLEWNVSDGIIIGGQNTSKIEVDLSEVTQKFVSVSILVKGLHPECENRKFTSTQVGFFPYKFDEFARITSGDLKARLDNFYNTLNAEMNLTGYIIIYQARVGDNKNSEAFRRNILNHMGFRRFDPLRIVLVDGGFREEMMCEFYLAPAGVDPPNPTPTLDSSFVIQPKKVIKKRKKTSK